MRRQDSLTLDMNWHSSIFAQHLAPAHHSVASWPMARSVCILGLFAGYADGNGRRAGMKSVEKARGQAHVCKRPNALTVACQRHLWAVNCLVVFPCQLVQVSLLTSFSMLQGCMRRGGQHSKEASRESTNPDPQFHCATLIDLNAIARGMP